MSDSGGPQGNNVEDEKKRSQHKSLHLSLKLEIAKLCEILLLPVCNLLLLDLVLFAVCHFSLKILHFIYQIVFVLMKLVFIVEGLDHGEVPIFYYCSYWCCNILFRIEI
jgi:hypothetical protein